MKVTYENFKIIKEGQQDTCLATVTRVTHSWFWKRREEIEVVRSDYNFYEVKTGKYAEISDLYNVAKLYEVLNDDVQRV